MINLVQRINSGAAATLTFARRPSLYALAEATAAGDTAIVAGVVGVTIRLFAYRITSNATLAALGRLDARLRNAAVNLPHLQSFILDTTATDPGVNLPPWIYLGTLGRALTAGNALNVNLSAACVTGWVRAEVQYGI